MSKITPLYERHIQLSAHMVEFAGWMMPLHYGSQIEEHHQVRRDAGMFDVSHMGIVDITGAEVQNFLRHLLANNIDKLKVPGSALYTCMLNIQGGVIDDLIVYFVSPSHYRLVVNAATTAKDLQWMQKEAKSFLVNIMHRLDLAMIAIQGPNAREKVGAVLPVLKDQIQSLKPFHFLGAGEQYIARTGYTGEDGVEVMLPAPQSIALWRLLEEQGVYPIGLGARDTLRLEAGLNLYGQDMDEGVTPLESNLGWTVAFDPVERQFVGRDSLETMQKKKKVSKQLVGLVLSGRGVLRSHQAVFAGSEKIGETTSGTFSPTLKKSIALARIRLPIESECQVDIRGQHLKACIVQPPFVRRKK